MRTAFLLAESGFCCKRCLWIILRTYVAIYMDNSFSPLPFTQTQVESYRAKDSYIYQECKPLSGCHLSEEHTGRHAEVK